jgi:hypothetical protein
MNTEIKSRDLVAEIEEITLAHMQVDIDPTDFLIGDKPFAGKRLAVWLVQQYYKFELERIMKFSSEDKPMSDSILKRALAISKWHAVNQASNVLPNIVDASVLHLLDDAERSGWYHHVSDEFDTLEELLASIVEDAEEQTPKFYNYSFIIKQILPMARSMDIDPDTILIASSQAKKVNILVPAARLLLDGHRDETISTKKVKEDLGWMLKLAADQSVPASQMKMEMEKYRGIGGTNLPMQGNVFLIGKERSLLVIETNTKREHKAVENALVHKVDFRFGEIGELLKLLLPEHVRDDFDASKITDLLTGGKREK